MIADLEKLESVNLVLTAACNLRCPYCYQNAKSPRRMSAGTLAAALDLVAASRAPEVKVAFLGGEPLLELPLIRRAAAQLADAAPGQRIRFSVVTNGVALAGDGLEDLIAHDVELRLSMDGGRAAQDLRAPGTFEVLDGLLIRLRRDHPDYFKRRVSAGITLAPAALPHLADSVRYFLGRRISSLGISPVITHEPGWRPERIGEIDVQFAVIHRLCLDHRRRTGETPLDLFRKNRGSPEGGAVGVPPSPEASAGAGARAIPMCSLVDARSVVVDVDGSVLGCTLFSSFSQRELPELLRRRLRELEMGRVGAPGLAERFREYADRLRESELFRDRRSKRSSYAACGECPHVAECGLCPVSTGHILGNVDFHRVPDFACAFYRTALSWRERFPALPTVEEIASGGAAGPHPVCERAAARRGSG